MLHGAYCRRIVGSGTLICNSTLWAWPLLAFPLALDTHIFMAKMAWGRPTFSSLHASSMTALCAGTQLCMYQSITPDTVSVHGPAQPLASSSPQAVLQDCHTGGLGTCSLKVLLLQISGKEFYTLGMIITGCSDVMARPVWATY